MSDDFKVWVPYTRLPETTINHKDLLSIDKLTAAVVHAHTSGRGRTYITLQTFGDLLGVSRTTIRESLKQIERYGVIKVGKNSYSAGLYTSKQSYGGTFRIPLVILKEAQLDPNSRMLLLWLFNIAPGAIVPSNVELARITGLARPTVIKCIRKLQAFHVIDENKNVQIPALWQLPQDPAKIQKGTAESIQRGTLTMKQIMDNQAAYILEHEWDEEAEPEEFTPSEWDHLFPKGKYLLSRTE